MTFAAKLLLVAVVAGAALFAYHRLTGITFADNRAEMSPLFCQTLGRMLPAFAKPVILIPGTKGSTLATDGTPAWLTLRQLLPGAEPLAYDPDAPAFQATGVLDRISLVPGLLEYAPYYRISAALACGGKAYFYPYDWRKNPSDNVAGLSALVDRVRKETGERPSLVAHSMGGLIAHAYMKDHADAVDRVAYVGVPFTPGLSFLDDIDQGSPVALDRSALSAAAVFSHPGSFALLPHGGTAYRGDSLMEASTWRDAHLSVFKDSGRSEDEATLERNLAAAKAFFAKLDAPRPMTNRFLFVIGNCKDTLASIDADGGKKLAPGDGRVVATGAMPVESLSLEKTVFNSCAVHDQQLNDHDVVDAIAEFITKP